MSDVVIQSDRLVRLIDGIHSLFATSRQPVRRHYEAIFFAGGRTAMQIVRDFHLIPTEELFLQAIQFANLRYPFDEVLLIDQHPGEGIFYAAASRSGGYAEDTYVWDEPSGKYQVQEGEVFTMVVIPPLFERPEGAVPPRISSWINANIHQASLPRT